MAADGDYDTLVDYSARVYRPDGKILFTLIKGAIQNDLILPAWAYLKPYNPKSENRGTSSGMKHQFRIKQDGTRSNTARIDPRDAVVSGVIGFYDRYPRIPYCRKCAWNLENPEKFKVCLPMFHAVDAYHEEFCPTEYEAQQAWADKTHRDFLIPETIYSTVTINKNYRTAYHLDGKNQAGGFSGMLLIRDGKINGGYTVFPEYRAAVKMDTGDLVFFNGASEWHGNTPISLLTKNAQRCTLVFYLRSGMTKCLSAPEELERAKRRQLGSPL